MTLPWATTWSREAQQGFLPTRGTTTRQAGERPTLQASSHAWCKHHRTGSFNLPKGNYNSNFSWFIVTQELGRHYSSTTGPRHEFFLRGAIGECGRSATAMRGWREVDR